MMTPPTNIKYHNRSSFLENFGLLFSIWLRYEYTKYVSNSTPNPGPVKRKLVKRRCIAGGNWSRKE